MKQQVFNIHGGDPGLTYEEYLEFLKNYPVDFNRHALNLPDYQENMQADLGDDFEVLRPQMPNKRNAKYVEWKIWFEKFIPFVNDGVILTSSSLGATFLAKYLSENDFPKKIKAVFLLAGAATHNPPAYNLGDFALPDSLEKMKNQAAKIVLYHSTDDNVVPISDLEIFKKAFPEATVRVFSDRGHFRGPHFPELIEDIKSLV